MRSAYPQELFDSVRADLFWLDVTDLSTGGTDILRDASARLRRLLVDERPTLQRLRRELGEKGEIRVKAPRLPSSPESSRAQAGGADRGGLKIWGMQWHQSALSSEEIRRKYESQKADSGMHILRMSQWLDSPCLRLEAASVNRRDVIKFVANKLGGVHFDDDRKEPASKLLTATRALWTVSDLDPIYAELCAIAQQLIAAQGVRNLVGLGSIEK